MFETQKRLIEIPVFSKAMDKEAIFRKINLKYVKPTDWIKRRSGLKKRLDFQTS